MRYSVTGPARYLTDEEFVAVERAVRALTNVDEFTTGGAYGIDTAAASVAFRKHPQAFHRLCIPKGKNYNIAMHDYPFHEIVWVEGGYMKRNDVLVAHADVLLAFPETLKEQRRSGTWATIRRAEKAGIEVRKFPLSAGRIIPTRGEI